MTTVDLARYQLVIDGRRVEAVSGQRYDSVDPYLGAPFNAYRVVGPDVPFGGYGMSGGTRDPFTLG